MNNTLKPIAEAGLEAVARSAKGLGRVGGEYAKGFGKAFERAAKRQGPKDGEKVFKWLRRLALTGVVGGGAAQTGIFAELSVLIAKYPEAFEWLVRVLHHIK